MSVNGYVMTFEEAEQYGIIVDRIIRARNARESIRDEFDGMTYEQTYLANKRAAMSYLQPKKNDDEVRINTGTTEKRIELVLNELLALNLEGEVRAFDKEDNLLQDVSDIFTDVVKRTEQIEHAKDKNVYYYKELLTQPSVFVEELWIQERVPGKKTFRMRSRCETRMLNGVQVYLGDVNLPDVRFNEQPYLVKYCRMTIEEAERVFKDLNPEKWEYVMPGSYNYTSIGAPPYKLYRAGSLDQDEVEVYYYMSYPDNEIQVYVQGIPWFEIGHKYTDEYGDLGGYHITMVGLNPYGWDFAYSKPLTQSAKTLQALNNETIRNLIRKFRQALEPPVGVSKGKMFSRDIWSPGSIAQGVKASDFERLIDHQGVTRSEMAMFDLVEKKTNEFIGTSQTEPLQGKTQVTATELNLAQKNAVRMLGNSVLAAMRLKDRLVRLRNRNILNNYTKPSGKQMDPITNKIKDVYARFTLENTDLGGQTGTKVIQFMDRSLSREEEEMVFSAEERGRKMGLPFRYKTVNVPALMDLELYFYNSITAKPTDSDQLDKAMLTEMMNQAAGVTQATGRRLNANKVVERFERVWKERDFFEKEAPQMMGSETAPNGEPMVPKGNAGMKLSEMMMGASGGQMPRVGDAV